MEKAILGSLLIEGELSEMVIPQLKEEYFIKHKELFTAIETLHKSGVKISLVSVSQVYPNMGELLDISNSVASTAHIDQWIRQLKLSWLRRKIYTITGKELGGFDDPEEYLTDYITELTGYRDEVCEAHDRSLSDIVDQALNLFYEKKTGIQTSITSLNTLDPFHPGRLIILGGRPSHGKTAFSLSILKTASDQGKKVLYFSLEMEDYELVSRILMTYENPEVGGGEVLRWPVKIIDKGGIGLDYVRSMIIKNKPDFVIIDYIGLMRLPKGEKRTYQLGDISHGLKNLAKAHKVPILALAQANREIEDRTDKQHRMSDLADSADLERDADFVMFTTRPLLFGIDFYRDDIKTENTAVIQVVKNRHGECKNIRVRTNESLTVWEDFNTF